MSFNPVACSRPASDAGYATPAAMVFSLALAVATIAVVEKSTTQLRLSRADLARTQVAYDLEGAQLTAAVSIVRSSTKGPFAWTYGSELGAVEAASEPEVDKLSYSAAAQLSDAVLARFGVRDAEALRARLTAADLHTPVWALDDAPAWRACAPGMTSPFGRAASFIYAPRHEPAVNLEAPAWYIGQAWRIRTTTAAGWRDDRIVRFTGDARHPAAVIFRRLSRGEPGVNECQNLLSNLAGA